MFDIEKLKFDEKGLIPAIVVDYATKKVLTLAYMNKESLKISLEKGLTCFYSRSRDELWLKGETSGNYQHVVSITADCDYDALEVRVKKDGPACHLGTDSCFTKPVYQSEELHEFTIQGLADLLQGRMEERPEGSYTTYLFEKGTDKILKKVGEECTEVIIAGKADDKAETVYIDLGSSRGIAKKQKFTVYLEVDIAGELSRKEIGSLSAQEVLSAKRTLCKVTKGGDKVLEAVKEGQKLVVVSRKERTFLDKI